MTKRGGLWGGTKCQPTLSQLEAAVTNMTKRRTPGSTQAGSDVSWKLRLAAAQSQLGTGVAWESLQTMLG
jgi:hypothetical protein